jgi:hypothetical protein
MMLRSLDFGGGRVDCWMRFRMRVISMGLDDGMPVVAIIGQRRVLSVTLGVSVALL